MERFLEIILGFLFGVRLGPVGPGVERAIGFNPPQWMSWWHFSPRIVNTLLVLVCVVVVVAIYRRDGRRSGPRIGLGILRALVLTYVLVLINRPLIVTTMILCEPWWLAFLFFTTAILCFHVSNRDGTPTSLHCGAATITVGPSPSPS